MFKIIGADQKEYGPVSTAQIRQWITDGRLNASTRAQREGGGDWQPLSAFEEFADIFQPAGATSAPAADPSAPFTPATPSAPIPTASRDMAVKAIKGPAIALIVIAGLGIGLYCLAFLGHLSGHHQDYSQMSPRVRDWMEQSQGPRGFLYDFLGVLLNGAVLFGAIRMLRLQGHTFAIITCIVAMLPCNCCCFAFNIPFAIWALIVLNKPEVKSQFTN
jgi:hypothetical protein